MSENTPTDDEREALAKRWLTNYHGSIDATALTLAFKAGLAAGFRRSEVLPEPTADDSMSHYTDPTDPFWQSKPEPQGEPSDAQVMAAIQVFYNAPGVTDWVDETKEDMRAALRAAGVAK